MIPKTQGGMVPALGLFTCLGALRPDQLRTWSRMFSRTSRSFSARLWCCRFNERAETGETAHLGLFLLRCRLHRQELTCKSSKAALMASLSQGARLLMQCSRRPGIESENNREKASDSVSRSVGEMRLAINHGLVSGDLSMSALDSRVPD